jgi:hypothetical protein
MTFGDGVVVLVLLGLGSVAVILYVANLYQPPKWAQRSAAGIRSVGRAIGKLCAAFIGLVILWYGGIEVLIWLAPENRYGYGLKYTDSPDQVFIQPKPHDCEWGKAPLGNKYCHFERQISFDKDEHGKVKAVYVNWEKVQE